MTTIEEIMQTKYIGTYDAEQLAERLSATLVNGNWESAIAEIGRLNPYQAAWCLSLMRETLEPSIMESLEGLMRNRMNEWTIDQLQEPLEFNWETEAEDDKDE